MGFGNFRIGKTLASNKNLNGIFIYFHLLVLTRRTSCYNLPSHIHRADCSLVTCQCDARLMLPTHGSGTRVRGVFVASYCFFFRQEGVTHRL